MAVILVTNDDGVNSTGIKALQSAMQSLGDAYIIAPDRERSAAGHSLTLHRPVKAEKLGEYIYSLNGTPTDCVTIGINKLLPEKPALVVSGINRGANLGDDITYSGTVSAAIEGTIFGIPSVAFSLISNKPYDYSAASFFALKIASLVIEHSLPYDTFLNVNIPNLPREKIQGVKFTRQGKRIYENSIQETYNPLGEKHYWIGGGNPYWEFGEDVDIEAVNKNFVSITPLHLDFTNYDALTFLKNRWAPEILKDNTDEKV